MTSERWQQIDELFQSALARGPHERADLLTQACAGDDELRRQVERLLASHEEAGSFINAPAVNIAAGMIADERAQEMKGQTVGHYLIVEPLAAGGMREVYIAEDIALGHKAALKLLPASFTRDEARVRRFRQEARGLGAQPPEHSNDLRDRRSRRRAVHRHRVHRRRDLA